MNNFNAIFEALIGSEGGYTNDRADRGNWTSGIIGRGELKGTKYGISAMSYPHLDIASITLKQAKDIYKRDYWDKLRLDDLPTNMHYMMFDAAVNHGRGNAARILQRAVKVNDDGWIGTITLGATRNIDPKDLLLAYTSWRIAFYTRISTFKKYGKGWMNRMAHVLMETTKYN